MLTSSMYLGLQGISVCTVEATFCKQFLFTMSSIIYWFPCRFKGFLLQNRSKRPQLCIFWCTYTVKNNSRLHNRASSDIEGIKYPFADSLIPFGNLIKEKHVGLKQYDGSFVKIHQEVLYKHLFGTEFQGHHALEDVKAKSKFLFRSSLQLHLYLFPKLPTKVAQPTLTQPSQIWTLTEVTLFLSHLME